MFFKKDKWGLAEQAHCVSISTPSFPIWEPSSTYSFKVYLQL